MCAHFTAAPGEGDSSHMKLIGGKLRWHQAPRLGPRLLSSSSRHQPTPGQLPLLRGAPQQLPGCLPAWESLHSSSAGHTFRQAPAPEQSLMADNCTGPICRLEEPGSSAPRHSPTSQSRNPSKGWLGSVALPCGPAYPGAVSALRGNETHGRAKPQTGGQPLIGRHVPHPRHQWEAGGSPGGGEESWFLP